MEDSKELSRRDFLRLGVVAGTGAVLAACAPKVEEKEVTKIVEETIVVEVEKEVKKVEEEIQLTAGVFADSKSAVKWNESLAAYTKEHPSIPMDLIPVPGAEYGDKMTIMLASGTAPDLLLDYSTFNHIGWADKGAILDLTPYYDLNKDLLLKLYTKTIKHMTIKGKMLLMPYTAEVSGLNWNKDLFDEGGVSEYPTDAWTWDDLREAAVKLTKRDAEGSITQYGFTSDGLWLSWTTGPSFWIHTNGGRNFNEDQTKCTMDSPESRQALQYFWDNLFVYKISPTAEDITLKHYATRWVAGEVALYDGISWGVKDSQDCELNPAICAGVYFEQVAKSPYSGKRSNFMHSMFWVVNKGTKYPEEAFEFGKWFMVSTGEVKRWGHLPAHADVREGWLDAVGRDRNQECFLKVGDTGVYAERLYDNADLDDKVWKIIGEEWNMLMTGEGTVDSYLESIVPKVNKLLQER